MAVQMPLFPPFSRLERERQEARAKLEQSKEKLMDIMRQVFTLSGPDLSVEAICESYDSEEANRESPRWWYGG